MANENRIGALWYPKTQSEKAPFAKGSIKLNGEEIRIVLWKNARKQPGEKFPDFHIDLDTWKPPERNAQVAEPVKQIVNAFAPKVEPFDDDIPF
jgi:hypothetical protein